MTDTVAQDIAIRGAGEVDEADTIVLSEKPESLGRQAWQRFRRHRLALVGSVLLVFLVLGFYVGEWLSPYTISGTDVSNRSQGPSLAHPFGTDPLGRDYFVRSMTGGQFSVRIAVLTALIATSVGTFFGAVAGYFGGFLDTAISFMINVLLSLPLILVLIVFGRRYGTGPATVSLLIALLAWTRSGRLVRAEVLKLKNQEYVQAARASGAGPARIILRHMIPNIIGIILVEFTLLAGTAIILESTLSFLGLGVKAPNTSLGVLVSDAKGKIDSQPWEVLIPGGLITAMILSFNFIGDALRDALDPTSGDG